MSLVGDGDTVIVDPGLYTGDVGTWTRNNLHLIGGWGSTPYAHLDAGGKSAQQKAIWVIAGRNTYVEGFEFSGCRVPDKNGAGIRQEGTDLTVRHCYFHDNEDGILTGVDPNSRIDIMYSEFAKTGAGDGYSHNMYIGHVRAFSLRFCSSHHANAGHLIKSRADSNWIDCNYIADETPGDPTGNSSYAIDLPNAGYAEITRNVIVKGAQAENGTIISYGEEGAKNPSGVLKIAYNTLVNKRSAATYLRATPPSLPIESHVSSLYNIIAGCATMYVVNGIPLETMDTNALALSAFPFRSVNDDDMHLTRALPIGSTPLWVAGYQYLNLGSEPRVEDTPNFGAFGFSSGATVRAKPKTLARLIAERGKLRVVGFGAPAHLTVTDLTGREIFHDAASESASITLAPGVYLYRIEREVDGTQTGKIVVW